VISLPRRPSERWQETRPTADHVERARGRTNDTLLKVASVTRGVPAAFSTGRHREVSLH
jgi:hypothetical protein